MSDLNKYIAIYIPSKDAKADLVAPVSRKRILEDVEKQFLAAFGGFTEYEATGGWTLDSGKNVLEAITIVKSFYIGQDAAPFRLARTLALVIKLDLKQEAVTIEQNGEISFI